MVFQVLRGKAFFRVFLFRPVSIIPPVLHIHLHLHVALIRRSGLSLGTFEWRNIVTKFWEHGNKTIFFLFLRSEYLYFCALKTGSGVNTASYPKNTGFYPLDIKRHTATVTAHCHLTVGLLNSSSVNRTYSSVNRTYASRVGLSSWEECLLLLPDCVLEYA